MLALAAAAYADCAPDSSDDALKTCLAQDLRDTDHRINTVYESLQASADVAGQLRLRDEQRAWLKGRDRACQLHNNETDRERWLQSVLASHEQTVCVVRFTFARVAQLDQALQERAPRQSMNVPAAPHALQFPAAASASAASAKLPAGLRFFDDGYKARTVNTHEHGRWYYEVWIDRGRIAAAGDLLLALGNATGNHSAVRLVNVRRSQTDMPPLLIGLAVDLDAGFGYAHQDGIWKFAPGTAGALVMPLTGPYAGTLQGSSEVRELIRQGLVKVNLGEMPFQRAPAGYRAWGEN